MHFLVLFIMDMIYILVDKEGLRTGSFCLSDCAWYAIGRRNVRAVAELHHRIQGDIHIVVDRKAL